MVLSVFVYLFGGLRHTLELFTDMETLSVLGDAVIVPNVNTTWILH